MARDFKYGLYLIPNESFSHEEEPIFIIRGKDKASADAIRAYGQVAYTHGASADLMTQCYKRAVEFEKWQERNSEIVKVPD